MPKDKMNYQEFIKLPETLKREEIINGVYFIAPSPPIRHQQVLNNLGFVIYQYVKSHNLGDIFFVPLNVILDNTNIVTPDIFFVSKAQSEIITEQNVQGSPDLIIEILSPSTSKRDLGIKKKTYEKFGVEHYWIVDPDKKTVQTFHLENNRYALPATFNLKETLSSPLFPGLSISMTFLFE